MEGKTEDEVVDIVAALLENNQTEQGIKIPAALVPYTGFEIID